MSGIDSRINCKSLRGHDVKAYEFLVMGSTGLVGAEPWAKAHRASCQTATHF